MPGSHPGPPAMLVDCHQGAIHFQICLPAAVKEIHSARGRIKESLLLLAVVNQRNRFERTGSAAASQRKSTTTSGGSEPVKASLAGPHRPDRDNRSSMVEKQVDPVVLVFQVCFGSDSYQSYPFRMLTGRRNIRHKVHHTSCLKTLEYWKETIYNKREHK